MNLIISAIISEVFQVILHGKCLSAILAIIIVIKVNWYTLNKQKTKKRKKEKENHILLSNDNVSLQEKRYCETLMIDVLFLRF